MNDRSFGREVLIEGSLPDVGRLRNILYRDIIDPMRSEQRQCCTDEPLSRRRPSALHSPFDRHISLLLWTIIDSSVIYDFIVNNIAQSLRAVKVELCRRSSGGCRDSSEPPTEGDREATKVHFPASWCASGTWVFLCHQIKSRHPREADGGPTTPLSSENSWPLLPDPSGRIRHNVIFVISCYLSLP